jgi:hypothetical protein
VQGEEEEEAPRKSQVWEEEEAKVQGNDLQVVWEEKSPLAARRALGKSLLVVRVLRKNPLGAKVLGKSHLTARPRALVVRVLGKSPLVARAKAPRKSFLIAEANQKVEASVQKKPEVKDGNEKRMEEGVHLLLLLLLQ